MPHRPGGHSPGGGCERDCRLAAVSVLVAAEAGELSALFRVVELALRHERVWRLRQLGRGCGSDRPSTRRASPTATGPRRVRPATRPGRAARASRNRAPESREPSCSRRPPSPGARYGSGRVRRRERWRGRQPLAGSVSPGCSVQGLPHGRTGRRSCCRAPCPLPHRPGQRGSSTRRTSPTPARPGRPDDPGRRRASPRRSPCRVAERPGFRQSRRRKAPGPFRRSAPAPALRPGG